MPSERNGSATEPMRFLQLWILPETGGLPPGVEQRQFTREDRRNRLLQVIGPEGDEVVKVHQDATVHVASLDPSVEVERVFGDGRAGYLYVIAGRAGLNIEHELGTGDALPAEPVQHFAGAVDDRGRAIRGSGPGRRSPSPARPGCGGRP